MIRTRILQYLENKEISKYKFYKEVGLSNGFLDKEGSIRSDICEKISYQYDDINLIWLLTGDGEMLLSNNNQPTTNKIFKLRTDKDIEQQHIPLYSLEATAGLVELFQNHADTKPIDTIHIPNLPKCDGAVFVTGDSMYPLLKSGDIVAYKQITDFSTEIFWGEMYLISVEVAGEEFISVKYIQKSDKGSDYIKLVSQNQHHQSKHIQVSKIRAMALVKASIRINSMG